VALAGICLSTGPSSFCGRSGHCLAGPQKPQIRPRFNYPLHLPFATKDARLLTLTGMAVPTSLSPGQKVGAQAATYTELISILPRALG